MKLIKNVCWLALFMLLESVFNKALAVSEKPWLPVIVYDLVDEADASPKVEPINDAVTIDWRTAIDIEVLANDPQNENYLPQLVSLPAHGSAEVIGNKIRFTPVTEFIGNDSFEYKIVSSDGSKLISTKASVSITITDIDRGQPPIAVNDSAITTGDNKKIYIDLIANDSDVDSDTLTIVSVTDAANGVVTIVSESSVSYQPNTDYCGTDTFNYVMRDELENQAQATVTITCDGSYTPPPSIPKILVPEIRVNSPLHAQQVYGVVTEQYASDSKYDLRDLWLILDDPNTPEVAIPDNIDISALPSRQDFHMEESGHAVINVNGGRYPLTYRGAILFIAKVDDGTDIVKEINYKLINPDGELSREWGKLRISLDDAFDQNHDYYPVDDLADTLQQEAVDIDVLSNDPDVQSYYSVEVYKRPVHGQLSINEDKTIRYTPNSGFTGIDTFKYKVLGNNLFIIDSAPAEVTVNVGEHNQAPVAVDDTMAVTDYTNGNTYDVIANDSDFENNFIYLLSVGNAEFGTVMMHSNRAVKYVPNNGVCQNDSFTYEVSQDLQGTLSDIGTVTVECVDDTLPQLFTVPETTNPNSTVNITWKAPIKSGVADYEIYGELKGRLTKQSFTADTNGVYSFSRPAGTEGREYCYKMRAMFDDGTTGNYTTALCTTVSHDGTPVFEEITNFSVSQISEQNFKLSWSPMAGASKYLIEQQVDASTTTDFGNQWQAIYYGSATSKEVQFSAFHQAVYNKLGRMTYRISACNEYGICGNYTRNQPALKGLSASAFLTSVPEEHNVPACIDLPSRVDSGASIPVSFCPAQVADVKAYHLYGELAGVVHSGGASEFTRTAQGLLTVTRPALQEGREYCYKVKSELTNGEFSGATETLCVDVGTIAFPATTTFMAVPSTEDFNRFELLWAPVAGADHYLLEQETEYGVWQAVDCVVDTFNHEAVDYQHCNVGISEQDIIPEKGKAVFRVSACNNSNICGNVERTNIELMTIQSDVFEKDEALYLQLESGEYLKLTQSTEGNWDVVSISKSEWDLLSLTSANISNYMLEAGEFSGDNLPDFKLSDGNSEIVVIQQSDGGYKHTQFGRRVIFIHTDLLGSPVAESDKSGNIL